MNYKDIFKKPVHNVQGKQPWYVKWSEGNEYSLIFNTYVDALFIGCSFGVILSILFPIVNNISFMFAIAVSPIPLIICSVLYYKYIYHYKSSASRYGLKPSFRFIMIYHLILQIILVCLFYLFY